MNVDSWTRTRDLRRQLAAMTDLPNNPAQLVRRHHLLNEIDWLAAGSPTHTEPEDRDHG